MQLFPLWKGQLRPIGPGVLQEVLQHTSVYAIQVAISWPSALMGAMTMLTVIASCLVIFCFHEKEEEQQHRGEDGAGAGDSHQSQAKRRTRQVCAARREQLGSMTVVGGEVLRQPDRE